MWKLVIEDDEGKRTAVPLTRDQYSIGRKEGNTIRLTERNVSRAHARLYKRNGGSPAQEPTFVVEDLASYNGVFVNGLRVTRTQNLAHGDLVQIGDYRIVLQDESLADLQSATDNAKQTVPGAATARAATLLDRPNRLVMLVGPTPGAEFPLEGERLTIGRAEDASISINHNSVSRMHCEVHALGDGRFEIVDKGSSNRVRVNGAELRRGIIEPNDIIELGDVKLKFVGAGQVFLAADTQPLPATGDRVRTQRPSRAQSTNALPLAAFILIVLAGAAGAWFYTRPRFDRPTAAAATAAVPSPDRAALDQAKRLCAGGDCEGAHEALSAILGTSPLRSTQDFKDIESRWADGLLARADREGDVATRRALYQRVSQTVTVEPARRKTAADKLQELDALANAALTSPMQLPAASAAPAAEDATPVAPAAHAEAVRRAPMVAAAPPPPPPPAPSPQAVMMPPPLPPPPTLPIAAATRPSSAAGVDDRERQLALQGTQDSKMLLKQQLEQRVYGGKASDTEIRLLISTCKDLGDKSCVQQARAIQAQRQP